MRFLQVMVMIARLKVCGRTAVSPYRSCNDSSDCEAEGVRANAVRPYKVLPTVTHTINNTNCPYSGVRGGVFLI